MELNKIRGIITHLPSRLDPGKYPATILVNDGKTTKKTRAFTDILEIL
jgi:hypothetical protein